MEDLFSTQMRLEEDARNLALTKLKKDIEGGRMGETVIGSYLVRNYVGPLADALKKFIADASDGHARRRATAAVLLEQLDPEAAALILLKGLYACVAVTNAKLTSTAIHIGNHLHQEVRIRAFEADNKAWFDKMWKDFDSRDLPAYKRQDYLRKVLKDADEEVDFWSRADKLHAGLKMIDLYMNTIGDISVVRVRQGKKDWDYLQASPEFLSNVERLSEQLAPLSVLYPPMIVPPTPWSAENINKGGYVSHHIPAYPLVKHSKRDYRRLIKTKAEKGDLDTVFTAINAVQETPWRVNTRVLDVLEYVYHNNIECGKLPRADNLEPDPPPKNLDGLPADHPDVMEYRTYRARVHEENRQSVAKRVMALSSMAVAREYQQYEAIYFPHDMDSRGRIYPRPYHLSPQGPDFVKGLIEFGEGKVLGEEGMFWLAFHGANCFGEDKLPIIDRAKWSFDHIDQIRSVAENPKDDLWWTKADSPVQFLAFCFEFAEAHPAYISHLHVDLDATCSGLQHFAGMLRDEIGGFYVNMTPSDARQDVYAAVAKVAIDYLSKIDGDKAQMAQAWLDSGMMDRKVSKRPVMVKPYAGTRQSCNVYVADAVSEKLKGGHQYPWPKDDIFAFKMLGAEAVWAAIPKVVVAADEAMRWLSKIAWLVGKSQPTEQRIEWTTPAGLPVWQYKFDKEYRRIKTVFDGSIYRPQFHEETDKLDPRKMRTSVAPSFVHSMDAAHLMVTVKKSREAGLKHFAMVHDSFGVHAADIPMFSCLIREAFVDMYETHDVLAEYLASATPLISEDLREEIPTLPKRGNLNLQGILENPFFFS